MLTDLDEMLLLQLRFISIGYPHGRADHIADLPPVETLGLALFFDPFFDIAPVIDQFLLAQLAEELDEDVAAVFFA